MYILHILTLWLACVTHYSVCLGWCECQHTCYQFGCKSLAERSFSRGRSTFAVGRRMAASFTVSLITGPYIVCNVYEFRVVIDYCLPYGLSMRAMCGCVVPRVCWQCVVQVTKRWERSGRADCACGTSQGFGAAARSLGRVAAYKKLTAQAVVTLARFY